MLLPYFTHHSKPFPNKKTHLSADLELTITAFNAEKAANYLLNLETSELYQLYAPDNYAAYRAIMEVQLAHKACLPSVRSNAELTLGTLEKKKVLKEQLAHYVRSMVPLLPKDIQLELQTFLQEP